jgi:flagellar biosynthesis/type III secretory pathway M-ring protein FliF/YscJ
MIPYNICESKWVSKTSKQVKKHWNEYEPVYLILLGIMGVALFVLMVITSISSFL